VSICSTSPKRLSPTTATADMFGVTTRTIQRWRDDPKMHALGFPSTPVTINGRRYDDAEGLEAFRQNLMRRALAAA
jgi:hypothetical protein